MTVTQLVTKLHDFSQLINNQRQLDAVFLEFAKALDKVPNTEYIPKLYFMGINITLIAFIRAYLTNSRQYVQIGKRSSGVLSATSGVSQGSVLGPILFLAHINDLVSVVDRDISIKLFCR